MKGDFEGMRMEFLRCYSGFGLEEVGNAKENLNLHKCSRFPGYSSLVLASAFK
jgi:hypothetical protein